MARLKKDGPCATRQPSKKARAWNESTVGFSSMVEQRYGPPFQIPLKKKMMLLLVVHISFYYALDNHKLSTSVPPSPEDMKLSNPLKTVYFRSQNRLATYRVYCSRQKE